MASLDCRPPPPIPPGKRKGLNCLHAGFHTRFYFSHSKAFIVQYLRPVIDDTVIRSSEGQPCPTSSEFIQLKLLFVWMICSKWGADPGSWCSLDLSVNVKPHIQTVQSSEYPFISACLDVIYYCTQRKVLDWILLNCIQYYKSILGRLQTTLYMR